LKKRGAINQSVQRAESGHLIAVAGALSDDFVGSDFKGFGLFQP
jgi:hypothetical protein